MPTGNSGLLEGLKKIGPRFRELLIDGGIPGAPLGLRLRGATAGGPPSSGTWRAGDTVTDRNGSAWICTSGGTPGRWSGNVAVLAPSGDTSGARDAAAINAAVSALPASGGRVVLAAGQWYVECGQVSINRSGVYIDGAGKWATFVSAVGAGDVFRMYDSSSYSARTAAGGGIRGMTIDGTSTTGNSTGIHAGDVFQLKWDVAVSNFNAGTTSAGIKFDNQWTLAEQMQGLVYVAACTTHVEFTQNPAGGSTQCTGSFERANLAVYIDQENAAWNGFLVTNGAYLENSFLVVGGNFAGTDSGAVTSAVFALTGSTPSGSADGSSGAIPSNLSSCFLNVGVECAGGFTYTPQTWNIGSGCYTYSLFGTMNFGAAGQNFTPATGTVAFFGLTDGGDPNIVAQTNQAWLFQGQLSFGTYAGAATLSNGSTVSASASWALVTSSAAVTGVILAAGTWDGQPLWVVNTGSYSVTMAAAGTSRVADGINDVIPAGQAAFYIFSIDTGTWYRVPQGTFTATLASTFTASATGTGAQNVTGLAAYLTVGTWKIRAYLPYQGASAAGTTHFGFTFGGTAGTGSIISWKTNLVATPFTAAPVTSATITTVSQTSATLATSPGAFYEATMTIAATAAGTLQLQVYNGTTGDDTEVLAGAFLEVTQVA